MFDNRRVNGGVVLAACSDLSARHRRSILGVQECEVVWCSSKWEVSRNNVHDENERERIQQKGRPKERQRRVD